MSISDIKLKWDLKIQMTYEEHYNMVQAQNSASRSKMKEYAEHHERMANKLNKRDKLTQYEHDPFFDEELNDDRMGSSYDDFGNND